MVKPNPLFFIVLLSVYANSANSEEYFFNAGLISYQADYLYGNPQIDNADHSARTLKLGLGIRNTYGNHKKQKVGFGVDYFQLEDQTLIGFRALDYQYQIHKNLQAGFYVGAATLDSGLPQNGYYAGISTSLLNLLPTTDILFEVSYGSGLARDRRPFDPPGDKLDIFIDFVALGLSLNWHF